MLGEPYGWGGGVYKQRDCSLFTKDFFTPFGILLNRNSQAQKIDGEYLDISEKTDQEKIEFIKKNGIPFQTLFIFKGHVGLYLGTYNNEPVFMHDLWGLQTKDADGNIGRLIAGKVVITSLKIGKEVSIVDPDSLLIKKIQGIVLVKHF